MNDAMPPWRTFGTNVPGAAPDRVPVGRLPAVAPRTWRPATMGAQPAPRPEPEDQLPRPRRRWWPWLAPVLAGVGGLLAGLSVMVVTVLLPDLTTAPAALEFGEPIGSMTVAGPGPGTTPGSEGIVVDVAGAVSRPGLHRLMEGDRVGDAILAAGGFGPRADLVAASMDLNLAEPLTDGTKVLVPELGSGPVSTASSVSVGGRIDLNRASQAELESLPGIGPVTARKIVDARAERRFGSVEDLRTRGLVGEAVYADIESLTSAG